MEREDLWVYGTLRRPKQYFNWKIRSSMLCRRFWAFLRHWSLSCSSEGCQATTALRIEQDDIHVLKLVGWYLAPSTSRIDWRLHSARGWRLASTEAGADNPRFSHVYKWRVTSYRFKTNWTKIETLAASWVRLSSVTLGKIATELQKKNKHRDQDCLCARVFFIHSIKWLVGIVSESGELLVSDSDELWYNELFRTITAYFGYLPNIPINLF